MARVQRAADSGPLLAFIPNAVTKFLASTARSHSSLQLFPRLRLPLTSQALGFGDLFGCHLGRAGVSVTLLFGLQSRRRSKAEPHVRLNEILRHAFAVGVHPAEVVLGFVVTLFSGEPIPLNGLGVVLLYALTCPVYPSEAVLGSWVTVLARWMSAWTFSLSANITCRLKRSTQHKRQNVLLEFQTPASCGAVRSACERSCPGALVSVRTSRFPWGSTV